jgi:hypothetical protein
MPNREALSDLTERPAVGQVWEHHSTGRYTVYGVHPNGSLSIRPTHHTGRGLAPDGGVNGARVWPDYFRANFRLVAGGEG